MLLGAGIAGIGAIRVALVGSPGPGFGAAEVPGFVMRCGFSGSLISGTGAYRSGRASIRLSRVSFSINGGGVTGVYTPGNSCVPKPYGCGASGRSDGC